MRRALCFLWIAALTACAGGGTQTTPPVSSLPAAANHTTETQTQAATAASVGFSSTLWNIGTGYIDPNHAFAIQDLDFVPDSITINAGDSIAFHVAGGAGGDAHTVAFVPANMPVPPPNDFNNLSPSGGTTVDGTKFVNSGILVGGQTFTLHFPTAGTFRILCLFHEPAMVMSVVVQKTGTPYPHTALYYRTVGAQDAWQDLTAAFNAIKLFPFTNGGTTLAAGIQPGLVHFPPPEGTVLRFLDSNNTGLVNNAGNMTIKVGTVLTFVNETTNEPHTVTILPAGQTDLPAALAPDPAINAVVYPGITTFDGTKLVNSGSLVRAPGAPFAFKVRFTKAGQYFYACIYHDNSGMDGRITVFQ